VANPGRRRKKLLVVAALIEDGDRVLLTRRKPHQSFPGHWEFPGGKVEKGESPTRALVREIQEEIGCRIQVGAVADVVLHAYPEFDLVMPVYRAKIVSGSPRPIEVAALAWVERRHLLRRKMPPADWPLAQALARTRVPR
jgi:8-oxo-dGTP diphosphatase